MKNSKMTVFAVAVFAAAMFFGNVEAARAQSMDWSGTVDDVIQIKIRNRNARIQHVSGGTTYGENYNFRGRAPRDGGNARVDKRDGRGRVFIVQQPSRRNNWTTVVQINDSKGGADKYRFTVYWD